MHKIFFTIFLTCTSALTTGINASDALPSLKDVPEDPVAVGGQRFTCLVPEGLDQAHVALDFNTKKDGMYDIDKQQLKILLPHAFLNLTTTDQKNADQIEQKKETVNYRVLPSTTISVTTYKKNKIFSSLFLNNIVLSGTIEATDRVCVTAKTDTDFIHNKNSIFRHATLLAHELGREFFNCEKCWQNHKCFMTLNTIQGEKHQKNCMCKATQHAQEKEFSLFFAIRKSTVSSEENLQD